MTILKIIFWISFLILFYSYLGYGFFLFVYFKFKEIFLKKRVSDKLETFNPHVTLIVPSYNSGEYILEKIKNTLELNYPEDKLKIIFITDGSSDKTPELIARYPRIRLMHSASRKGKVAAMNRAIKEVNTPITVFCDDNTFLNKDAINQLVKHYADPRIGAVAGEKKVMDLNTGNAASTGESFYWKYESFLKKMDFEFYSVVGAAGELFSVRTALFKEPEEDTLLDDFIISLRICMMGYRVAYEPEAYALERPSASLRDEQKRKIRISAGGFQSIVRLRSLLNIFKYGKLSFQYISHRVLRWAVCPFLLPVLIVTNLFIVMGSGEVLYQLLMTGQLIFYLAALGGWLFSRSNIKFRLFSFPYYFLFINISLYHGLIRYFRGSQSVLWEKAERDI